MSLWTIVPVKPLRRGKSRLSEVLTEQQRVNLNRSLLINTVNTLRCVSGIEHVLVVSRDQEALSIAREHNARTLLEDGSSHLNIALTRATMVASAYSAHGVLVVPADLPFLSEDEVQTMVEFAQEPGIVVIAPDRHEEGTNALLLAPPDLIRYDFGPNSFERHCQHARNAGVRLTVFKAPSIELDIDWPEDLALLNGKFGKDFELQKEKNLN